MAAKPLTITEAYLKVLRQVWEDRVVTAEESNLLQTLRKTMGITKEKHLRLLGKVMSRKRVTPRDLGRSIRLSKEDRGLVYELVLTAALEDAKITQDEFMALRALASALGIDAGLHSRIENTIREELHQSSRGKKPRMLAARLKMMEILRRE